MSTKGHPSPSQGISGSAASLPRNKGLGVIDWGIGLLVRASLLLSGCAVVAIIAIGSVDTIGRAFWNYPLAGAVEMTEALLAASIFLALGYAQSLGEHISVDLFTQSFGPRMTRVAHYFALITTLAIFLFILWRTFDTAVYAWGVNEVSAGIVPVPIWLAKAFATVGLVVASLETMRQLVWLLAGRDVIAERRQAAREEQNLGLE